MFILWFVNLSIRQMKSGSWDCCFWQLKIYKMDYWQWVVKRLLAEEFFEKQGPIVIDGKEGIEDAVIGELLKNMAEKGEVC